ncbi:MAG TPA: hypothetical protein VF443_06010, partial [Nitrospira sp.]
MLDLPVGEVGMAGNRQHAPIERVGAWQLIRTPAATLIGRLPVNRHRIVAPGCYSGRSEMFRQAIPILTFDDKEMHGVQGIGYRGGRARTGALQRFVMTLRDRAPSIIPSVEVRKFDPENGCLNLIE